MKQYRISVNLNRISIPWEEDFEKARAYHFAHGVDIEFVCTTVDVHGYQSVYNEQIKRYIIDGAENLITLDTEADTNMFVFDHSEWATPEGSLYPLLPNTPNGSCTTANGNKPFICIGTYITEHENGQTWIQIAHEIMHSYVQNAYLEGIPITDVMDTYRENSNPDSPTSNFTEQWKLLEPYFNSHQKTPDVA